MPLDLRPLGTLDIYAASSWAIEGGPRGTRSVTDFDRVLWRGPVVEAHSLWANGTYLATQRVAEPHIRVFFETDEAERAHLFLEYHARFAIEESVAQPSPGENPVYLAGRIETADERYAWLNTTQIVGKGAFDPQRLALSYEVYALS